jgi:hypothetical protein
MSFKVLGHGLLACGLLGSILAACGEEDDEPPVESLLDCGGGQMPSCPSPPTTFTSVAPIFGERCATPCHSGAPNGPWPLATYEHIFEWRDQIKARLLECAMPPPESGITITNDERRAILAWISCGSPE